jgi:hypothetical protein
VRGYNGQFVKVRRSDVACVCVRARRRLLQQLSPPHHLRAEAADQPQPNPPTDPNPPNRPRQPTAPPHQTYIDATVPELAFGEYWDACEYSDGVLNYNQVGLLVLGGCGGVCVWGGGETF